MYRACRIGVVSLVLMLHEWSAVAAGADPSKIPAPFSRWSECQLVSLVYPLHDCATGAIGEGRGAQMLAAMPWSVTGSRQLLAMIETYDLENGQRPTYGASEYRVDLALFDGRKDAPVVQALAKGLLTHGGHGTLVFDRAVYVLSEFERAIGIRHPAMHQGLMVTYLYLIRQERESFRTVFERVMERGFDMRESAQPDEPAKAQSILQVLPHAGGMSDFKIVTRSFGWSATDDSVDQRQVLSTATELWRWNRTTGVYALSP